MTTSTLAHFAILPDGDQYRLRLAMKDGSTTDIMATFDQLDALAEEIDRLLDADQDIPMPSDD